MGDFKTPFIWHCRSVSPASSGWEINERNPSGDWKYLTQMATNTITFLALAGLSQLTKTCYNINDEEGKGLNQLLSCPVSCETHGLPGGIESEG